MTAVMEAIPYRREGKQPPFNESSRELGAVAFGCVFHAVKEIVGAVFN